jgi:hypothetical protein
VICHRCEQRITRDLDNVGKIRHDLHEHLTPGRGRGGKAPGKPGSKPPARLDVISATDTRSCRMPGDPDDVVNIDACLLAWGRATIEERQLAHPLRDVFDVLRVLNMSREWWCRHPAVDEFAKEIRDCAIALRRLIGDVAEPVVGKCPAVDPEGQQDDCNGPLRLEYAGMMLDDPDAPNAPTGLVCGRCGGRWDTDAATMVQFLRVVQPQARFPVPRDWAVREYQHLGLSHALLRLWVHRGHVHGYDDGQVDLVGVLARMVGDE